MMVRLGALVVLVLLLLAPSSADAQYRRGGQGLIHGPISLGPRVGRDFENHAWTAGGQVSIPLGRNLEIRPSGDFFFPKHGSTGWQANGDAAIHFGQGGGLYGGGGVAFFHPGGGETSTGYNLFFGLSTAAPSDRSKPFAEFRWTFVNDTSPFRLALGLNFRM
ncbi:MAG TPA: hypothetical protein VF046_12475 [Gemmatimonadales bacterium]